MIGARRYSRQKIDLVNVDIRYERCRDEPTT